MKEVTFSYGVFAESLEKQAEEQGYKLKDADKFEKIRKAIYMCRLHVATESQVNSMLKKLNNEVIENLVPLKR